MAKHLSDEQKRQIPDLFAQYLADGLTDAEALKKLAFGLKKTVERIRQIVKQPQPPQSASISDRLPLDYCKVEPLTSNDFEVCLLEKAKLPKEKRIKLTGSKVELFATDIHFPFENKSAWQIFLNVAKETQPDIIWLNGDNIDGYSVSQWTKDANIAHEISIQYEFDYCREQLQILRDTAPNAQIYYKEGNHETRLQRFLDKNAPALRSLRAVTIPYNLDLERLEIEWVENNDKFRIGELWHFHGNEIGGGGMNIALAKLRKLMSPIIFGHYHTSQSAIIRKYDGQPIGAWAIAALCDFDQDYLHHAETWSTEIARIEYLPSGIFHVQPSQFIKDDSKMICRVDGQWFEQGII